MELLLPGFGLVFWTTLAFGVVLFLLGKFAWPVILKSIREREESIENALESAEKAKEELKGLQANNEKLLKEAQEERFKILNQAKENANKMVEEAKTRANEEANKVLEAAKVEIDNQKQAVVVELKNISGKLAVDIATQILKKELSSDTNQMELVESVAKDLNLN